MSVFFCQGRGSCFGSPREENQYRLSWCRQIRLNLESFGILGYKNLLFVELAVIVRLVGPGCRHPKMAACPVSPAGEIMTQSKPMRRSLLPTLCFAVFFLFWLPGRPGAATTTRPVVEKNFQQLVETNSCPSCDLAGAMLNRIDLSDANLEGANLAGASLYLANLSGANLRNANLQGAGLGGADLAGADLRGANLTGAVLEGAYLKGALMDGVVTTRRSPDEDGVAGAGKTVFVGDGSRPKHKPYTQEVVVAPRQDLATMPAESSASQGKEHPEQGVTRGDATAGEEKQDSGVQGPKKLPPMADAVVPATVLPAKPAADTKEVVPLAAGASAVGVPAHGRQEDSGRQDGAPAAAMAQPGQAAPPVPETVTRQKSGTPAEERPQRPGPGAETRAGDEAAAVGASGGKVEEESGPVEGDGAAVPAGETVTADREETATAASAAGSQETEGSGAAGSGPPVSAEKASSGREERRILVERLLDENQCPECDLQQVDLSGRWLSEADLERADLRGANLKGADLRDANLKGADLRGADLREADLRGADLYMANLEGADLTGARMEGALVDSADLTGAIGLRLDAAEKGE